MSNGDTRAGVERTEEYLEALRLAADDPTDEKKTWDLVRIRNKQWADAQVAQELKFRDWQAEWQRLDNDVHDAREAEAVAENEARALAGQLEEVELQLRFWRDPLRRSYDTAEERDEGAERLADLAAEHARLASLREHAGHRYSRARGETQRRLLWLNHHEATYEAEILGQAQGKPPGMVAAARMAG